MKLTEKILLAITIPITAIIIMKELYDLAKWNNLVNSMDTKPKERKYKYN